MTATQDPVDKKKKSLPANNSDPRKCSWLDNFNNGSLSGIEFRKNKSNKVVNFIAIQHDDDLVKPESGQDATDASKPNDTSSSRPAQLPKPFRTTILVDEDDTFTLPAKKTFEEMIQAKRRQQMLLYGPGPSHSASHSAVLSNRAAQRVAAAARRQQAAAARAASTATPTSASRIRKLKLPRDSVATLDGHEPEPSTANNDISSETLATPQSSRTRLPAQSKTTSKKRPPPAKTATTPARNRSKKLSKRSASLGTTPIKRPPAKSKKSAAQSGLNGNQDGAYASTSFASPQVISGNQALSTSTDTSIASNSNTPLSPSKKVVTSVKELFKQNPSLSGIIEPKKIKLMLKDATPGSQIVMPDGTILKKSRRGGARAGAGRKRSRPQPEFSNLSDFFTDL